MYSTGEGNVQRRHWLVLTALAAGGALAFAAFRPRAELPIADLIARLAEARKQPDSAFEVAEVTIGDRTRRSIIARGQTRLTFHVTVPKHAILRVALALEPSVWTQAGDGVLFLVGISDGRVYRTAESIVINPFGQTADRRWHDVSVSLEEFAGLTVDVILNTRAGMGPEADTRNDVAVWGDPSVIIR